MDYKQAAEIRRGLAGYYGQLPHHIGGTRGAEIAALLERAERMEAALENIAVYGCGMFSQPAALK